MDTPSDHAPEPENTARVRAEAATDGAIFMAFLSVLTLAGMLAVAVMDNDRSMWAQPLWWLIVPPVWAWLWTMKRRLAPAIRLVPVALIGAPLSGLVATILIGLSTPAGEIAPPWEVAAAATAVSSAFSALGWYAYLNSLIRWRDLSER